MKTTAYRRGYMLELKARNELLKAGMEIVVRSSRSLTPIDLVALNPSKREIWLVQVKKRGGATGSMETLRKRFSNLKNLAGNYTVKAVLYIKHGGKYEFIEL